MQHPAGIATAACCQPLTAVLIAGGGCPVFGQTPHGITKPEAGKATKVESPAAGMVTQHLQIHTAEILLITQ